MYQGYFSLSPTTIDHNLFIKGDYVYEANYTSGLQIFDAVSAQPRSSTAIAVGFSPIEVVIAR